MNASPFIIRMLLRSAGTRVAGIVLLCPPVHTQPARPPAHTNTQTVRSANSNCEGDPGLFPMLHHYG
eukprot:COSAG02_NODE_5102_length_4627_cov_2.013466_2_plen_67_part_00